MIPIFRDRELQKAVSCVMENWICFIIFFYFLLIDFVNKFEGLTIVSKMICVSFLFLLLPFVVTKYQGSLCYVKGGLALQ